MKLAGARIVVTGASSGIGRAVALALARAGAALLLVGRCAERLQATTTAARAAGAADVHALPCDVSNLCDVPVLVERAAQQLGGVDALVHAAGTSTFGPFAASAPAALEQLVRTNLLSSMVLAHALLPRFSAQRSGTLLFVGSIFGSIGFPWFSAYSATKFGVHGFAQALRREYAGSGVRVLLVAPRGTRTRLTRDYGDMAAAVKMPLDSADLVAQRIVDALSRDRAETFLGAAEHLFVRLNAWFPRLVDRALVRQRDRMAPFARARAGGSGCAAASHEPAIAAVEEVT